MLFTSLNFILFFIISWAIFFILRKKLNLQNLWLCLCSLFFYGFWDWRFLVLMLASIIFSFFTAKIINNLKNGNLKVRKYIFFFSICICLAPLGFFKYFNFFQESLITLFHALGMNADYATINIILPVGISFYTFQLLSYIIDVYYDKEKVCNNIILYTLYISFFPQLVAGPIERSTHLIPLLNAPKIINKEHIQSGLKLIIMGFFKKVFIADNVAVLVGECFNLDTKLGAIAYVCGTYLFALQIYGDFAGYTDIARGVGCFFGINLTLNFKQPYLATNITDFWRRWHISLSLWLRDYLYIPLGGNRKGHVRTYMNNLITMLLGGLWHGAGWNYIIWGGLHGIALAIHKIFSSVHILKFSKKNKIVLFLCTFFTFNFVCFVWIFFRADNFTCSIIYISRIFNNTHIFLGYQKFMIAVLFFGFFSLIQDILCYVNKSEVPIPEKLPNYLKGFIYALMIFLMCTFGGNDEIPFVYFQF